MYGQSKLIVLVTNIAMQRIKAVEAADVSDMLCTCKTQWYIIGMLTIITLGMLYLVTNKLRKSSFFKGHLFSNNIKILLLIFNSHPYVPIKLCRVARSIHLFRIRGRLNSENVKLEKNWIWDVLEKDWSNVSITLNDNEIDLPSSVIMSFKERYRTRRLLRKHPLLFYIMLKQSACPANERLQVQIPPGENSLFCLKIRSVVKNYFIIFIVSNTLRFLIFR